MSTIFQRSRARAAGTKQAKADDPQVPPAPWAAAFVATLSLRDHDLNSFRLRLDPVAAVDGLEPGMTVWLQGRQ